MTIDPSTVPVRFSNLRRIAQSPAHYRHAVQFADNESTLARRLGTGAHALTFGTPPVVQYTDRRAGKAWEAFRAEHEAAGVVILNAKEYAAAIAIARAIRSDRYASPLLLGPDVQREIQVSWEFNGRACTGRIDALHPTAVVDLKTARTAEPARFAQAGRWSGYHAQVAWYADGIEAAGLGWRHPYLIAVESTAPNPVTVMKLTDRAIEQGRALYRGWFERLLVCEASNEWPGYAQGVVDFDVPDESFELDWGDGDGANDDESEAA